MRNKHSEKKVFQAKRLEDLRVSKNKFSTPCDAGSLTRSCIGCIIFLFATLTAGK